MTTIKSYTDLEQSKKLAKILPIESADMYWFRDDVEVPRVYPKYMMKDSVSVTCPCWSLATLLNILPTYLFEFDRGIDLNVYPRLNSGGWNCSYMQNCIENKKTDNFRLITNGDNLIDACVDMIEKLHELKLL